MGTDRLTDAEKEVLREWARGDEVYTDDWDDTLFAAVEPLLLAREREERIRNRVAKDADLLERIGEDELFIADVRARLSQAEAERDRLQTRIDKALALADELAALSPDEAQDMTIPMDPDEVAHRIRAALGGDAGPDQTVHLREKATGPVCGHGWHMSDIVEWTCDRAPGHAGLHGSDLWIDHPMRWTNDGEYVDPAPAETGESP
jgi:hypothetical protein